MKEIQSLFMRDYEGNRQVYDEVVPGPEWVINGEGTPTVKWDGTSCMYADGILYKRYDAKNGKTPPDGWIACEEAPNKETGHFPGWLPVQKYIPEDKWHIEAWENQKLELTDGTYELIGPKIQGNPHHQKFHRLVKHGAYTIRDYYEDIVKTLPCLAEELECLEQTFQGIKKYLSHAAIEGIVWHHPDGRMVKIKARDFGIKWPRELGV